MTLTDIIALAKEGYKPSDIKELIALGTEAPEKTEEAEQKTQEEESANDKAEEKEPEAEEQEAIDYKSKYEEVNAKLAELQKAFTNQNNDKGQDHNDNDLFMEAMKKFM